MTLIAHTPTAGEAKISWLLHHVEEPSDRRDHGYRKQVRQLPCNPGWHVRPAFGFWLGERPLGLDGQPLDREPEVW